MKPASMVSFQADRLCPVGLGEKRNRGRRVLRNIPQPAHVGTTRLSYPYILVLLYYERAGQARCIAGEIEADSEETHPQEYFLTYPGK